MNDLIQPRNRINESMHETARAGQHDRKILSTLYRLHMNRSPVHGLNARLMRIMEARYTRLLP